MDEADHPVRLAAVDGLNEALLVRQGPRQRRDEVTREE
jgi:hypothetical protein